MTERDAIEDLAREVRDFLEDAWRDWRADRYLPQPEIASASMCRMSAAFLADRLSHDMGGVWTVSGGAGDEGWDLGDCLAGVGAGGMLTTSGGWSGHWWVVGQDLIVDVTADQFGHPEVIVTEASDPRYRRNYTKKATDRFVGFVKNTRSEWNRRWLERPTAGPRP